MCKKKHMRALITGLLICTMMPILCGCGKREDFDSQESTYELSVAESEETFGNTENDGEDWTDSTQIFTDEETSEVLNDIEENTSLEPEDIYTQVLDGYYADLVSEFPIDNYCKMTLGTFETTMGCTKEDALNGVGYAIKDINEDGIEELLIVQVSNRGETLYHGERILALYTIVNNEAHFLTGGWARNRYFLLNDGRIYNEGSSGADDSSFEVYRLIENTGILEQIDSGNSKSADYVQQCEAVEKLIETVELKTFAEYEISEKYPESAKIFWSAVYVNPAENTLAFTGDDSYTASTSEYAKEFVFFTPSEVSDFKLNALKAVNTNDGEVAYTEEELYSLDRLIMDKAVTITVEFPGDTPNYGISYTDAGGNIRRYVICESGFDGSIYLAEYKVYSR